MSYVDKHWIIENTTGSPELDNYLRSHENDLETFFDLNINLFFGTELSTNGNAFFSPFCRSLNCNGQIVLGKWLMAECFDKSDGSTRILSVMAHEFAHAMQHKFGWSGNSKLRELHADFLAGYYVGKTQPVNESQFKSAIQEFCERGDFAFNDPNHHGTPEERGCAFLEGFKYALSSNSVYNAYNAGRKYVIDNNPCYSYGQQTSRSAYYLPPPSADLYGIYLATVIVGGTIFLSNDVYYHRIYSFSNPKTENDIEFRNGRGGSFGLRRQFNQSALEYGVSGITYQRKGNFDYGYERQVFFNLNYMHDLNIDKIPKRIQPNIGLGLNLGQGAGIAGIFGFYLPVVDRLKFDFRYEIGTRTHQVQFGLIYKYQKDYLWNK